MKAKQALYQGLSPLWTRLHKERITGLAKEFRSRKQDTNLIHFLAQRLKEAEAQSQFMQQRYLSFEARMRKANRRQRAQHLLDFARDLGAGHRQLAGDRRALDRFFDEEALRDRYARRLGEWERERIFLMERLGYLTPDQENPALEGEVLRLLYRFIVPGQKEALRVAALEAIYTLLHKSRFPDAETGLPNAAAGHMQQLLENEAEDAWVRCAALQLLASLHPPMAYKGLTTLFRQPLEGDQVFVRHRGLNIIGGSNLTNELIRLAKADPSPFVRQGLCAVVPDTFLAAAADTLGKLIAGDPAEEVRGAALMALPSLAERVGGEAPARALLVDALKNRVQGFPARVAVQVALQMCRPGPDLEAIRTALAALRFRETDPRVCREAGQAMERLWCMADPKREQLRQTLSEKLAGCRPGKSVALPKSLYHSVDGETFGRVLSVLAQEDFGLDLERGMRGYRLRRTPRFGFRFWRWWHEIKNPAPDKRQGHDHRRGRVGQPLIQAPSGLMCETSPTRVPGEPLLIPEEGDWRPYLPLPSDALGSLDLEAKDGPLQIFTSEGKVTLDPPKGLATRLRAALKLHFGFARYARLRNWREGDPFAPDAYAGKLRDLNFNLHIQAWHQGAQKPSHINRFFAAPALLTPEHWTHFRDYLGSIYDNSLRDLAVVAGVALVAFLSRSAWLYHQIRAARQAIPLVIGGWGTRGKSGVERLKGALFNALGVRFLTKTTGCEARFLVAPAMGPQHDLLLYRPSGKATIWEQATIARIAAKLKVETVLWECMGLNAQFIRVLQGDWMRDDIATITNTHPDHEDIQGPSGLDVAQTISEFVPKGSQLITAEEHFLPVLKQKARERGTSVNAVGWLQAGLLPKDLLARFPYEEHPNNIALVLELAKSLGVKPDFALKEMADRVVPDVGVLKRFPAAPVQGRTLTFVSGNSANERLGCLSNWQRAGFERLAAEAGPETMVTVIANNRADRPARAQVFADILARDLQMDQIVITGSNLEGMQRLLEAAWDTAIGEWSIQEGFERLAQRLRVPTDPETVKSRLALMVRTLADEVTAQKALAHWEDPKEVEAALTEMDEHERAQLCDYLQRDLTILSEFLAMRERLAEEREAAEADAGNLLKAWLKRKTLLVDTPQDDPETLVDALVGITPFGVHNHLMGVANIKGPGLALIRAFQDWEKCQALCRQIRGRARVRNEDLIALANLGSPNSLSRDTLGETLQWCLDNPGPEKVGFDHHLLARLQSGLDASAPSAQKEGKAVNPLVRKLSSALETFLETGDAVKRRKRVNRIYKDLMHERISFNRAAAELQAIEARQHGGWLLQKLRKSGS